MCHTGACLISGRHMYYIHGSLSVLWLSHVSHRSLSDICLSKGYLSYPHGRLITTGLTPAAEVVDSVEWPVVLTSQNMVVQHHSGAFPSKRTAQSQKTQHQGDPVRFVFRMSQSQRHSLIIISYYPAGSMYLKIHCSVNVHRKPQKDHK